MKRFNGHHFFQAVAVDIGHGHAVGLKIEHLAAQTVGVNALITDLRIQIHRARIAFIHHKVGIHGRDRPPGASGLGRGGHGTTEYVAVDGISRTLQAADQVVDRAFGRALPHFAFVVHNADVQTGLVAQHGDAAPYHIVGLMRCAQFVRRVLAFRSRPLQGRVLSGHGLEFALPEQTGCQHRGNGLFQIGKARRTVDLKRRHHIARGLSLGRRLHRKQQQGTCPQDGQKTSLHG